MELCKRKSVKRKNLSKLLKMCFSFAVVETLENCMFLAFGTRISHLWTLKQHQQPHATASQPCHSHILRFPRFFPFFSFHLWRSRRWRRRIEAYRAIGSQYLLFIWIFDCRVQATANIESISFFLSNKFEKTKSKVKRKFSIFTRVSDLASYRFQYELANGSDSDSGSEVSVTMLQFCTFFEIFASIACTQLTHSTTAYERCIRRKVTMLNDEDKLLVDTDISIAEKYFRCQNGNWSNLLRQMEGARWSEWLPTESSKRNCMYLSIFDVCLFFCSSHFCILVSVSRFVIVVIVSEQNRGKRWQSPNWSIWFAKTSSSLQPLVAEPFSMENGNRPAEINSMMNANDLASPHYSIRYCDVYHNGILTRLLSAYSMKFEREIVAKWVSGLDTSALRFTLTKKIAENAKSK